VNLHGASCRATRLYPFICSVGIIDQIGRSFLIVSLPPDSFPAMSCVPVDEQLRTLLIRLASERVPANEIPTDLLDQLRAWGWVMGQDRLELTGIGYYHAGTVKRGLLG
jgi:hypothetical protein